MIEREAKTDAGPAEDRPRDLQPAGHRHAAADRRHACCYGTRRPAIDPDAITFDASSAQTPDTVQHVPATPGCRRRRSPTRAGRRSRRRCNPAPEPERRATRCAPTCPTARRASTCTTCSPTRTGNHAFAVTRRAAPGQRADAAADRRPALTVTAAAVPGVAALIGSPVAHSLSPAIHNAAFAAAGLDWSYVAFDVAPGRGRRGARRRCATLGIAGLSVTTPHKEDVAAAVDELAPAAAALRSVNTVVARRDGRLVGHSTDGDGFVASLAAARRRRRPARASPCSAPGRRRAASSTPSAGPAPPTSSSSTARRHGPRRRPRWRRRRASARRDDVAGAPTSSSTPRRSACGTDELPFDPALLRAGPGRRRPRVPPAGDGAAARRRAAGLHAPSTGSACSSTRPSLQQQLWTGRRPDPAVMRAAAEAELARRRATDPDVRRPSIGGPSTCGDSDDGRPVASPPMLRYLTAGESHGQALVVIVEGLPAGLAVTVEDIQAELARRRLGYGRGPAPALRGRRADADRRRPPRPHARLAGRHRDQEHRVVPQRQVARRDVAGARAPPKAPLTQVRPGHADLAGMQKYGFTDARDVLERASARETAARVAAGALAKLLLARARRRRAVARRADGPGARRPAPGRRSPTSPTVDESPVRCFDPAAAEAMIAEIKAAAKDGDSLGGVVEVLAYGVPGRPRQPRALGPQARRPARPGGDEHPGREGRRDRRRLRGRRAAGERGPRRRSAGTPTPATTAATPRSPAASRAACRPASCSSCGRR